MKRPPSRWWHVISVLVFLIGALGSPITMVFLMLRQFAAGEEFFVPGTHALHLQKPGKYVVWNVTSEFRDGQQYGYPDSLPVGTRIRIIDDGSGTELPTTATMTASESSGNTKRRSVCSFITASPGSYSVVVDGTDERRLLMVRPSIASRVILFFIVGGVGSVLGWILPPVISVVVEVRRYRARKESANQQINTIAGKPGSG